ITGRSTAERWAYGGKTMRAKAITTSEVGRLAFSIILFFISIFAGENKAQAADVKVHPEMIVSAQWLSEHLSDPKVVVLHVARKRSEYDNGHIPGARLLTLEDFIEGDDAELPPPEKLKDAFEKVGIS